MQPYSDKKCYSLTCKCRSCGVRPEAIRRIARKGARRAAKVEIARQLDESPR